MGRYSTTSSARPRLLTPAPVSDASISLSDAVFADTLAAPGAVVPGARREAGAAVAVVVVGEVSPVFVESPQPTVRTFTVMMQMQDSVALLAISSPPA